MDGNKSFEIYKISIENIDFGGKWFANLHIRGKKLFLRTIRFLKTGVMSVCSMFRPSGQHNKIKRMKNQFYCELTCAK